jgi:topoisomerase IA-like protein
MDKKLAQELVKVCWTCNNMTERAVRVGRFGPSVRHYCDLTRCRVVVFQKACYYWEEGVNAKRFESPQAQPAKGSLL